MPEIVTFATKPKLAVGMVARAVGAGVPFAWVAADSEYGVGELEAALRRSGKGYVLGVNANLWFGSWNAEILVAGEAKEIAEALPDAFWTRLSAGDGTKGERLDDWAYCPLADLDAAENDAPVPGLWTFGMLIRRSVADGALAYFTTWCFEGTSIETLVRVEGTRWRVEEGLRPPRTSSGSTITRAAPGTDGTGTSLSSCSPM